MEYAKWVNQGDQRYMTMGTCPEHDKLLVRLKFHKSDTGFWTITRMTYQATESMQSYYKAKAAHNRKHRRGGKRRTKAKAQPSV